MATSPIVTQISPESQVPSYNESDRGSQCSLLNCHKATDVVGMSRKKLYKIPYCDYKNAHLSPFFLKDMNVI